MNSINPVTISVISKYLWLISNLLRQKTKIVKPTILIFHSVHLVFYPFWRSQIELHSICLHLQHVLPGKKQLITRSGYWFTAYPARITFTTRQHDVRQNQGYLIIGGSVEIFTQRVVINLYPITVRYRQTALHGHLLNILFSPLQLLSTIEIGLNEITCTN